MRFRVRSFLLAAGTLLLLLAPPIAAIVFAQACAHGAFVHSSADGPAR